MQFAVICALYMVNYRIYSPAGGGRPPPGPPVFPAPAPAIAPATTVIPPTTILG